MIQIFFATKEERVYFSIDDNSNSFKVYLNETEAGEYQCETLNKEWVRNNPVINKAINCLVQFVGKIADNDQMSDIVKYIYSIEDFMQGTSPFAFTILENMVPIRKY